MNLLNSISQRMKVGIVESVISDLWCWGMWVLLCVCVGGGGVRACVRLRVSMRHCVCVCVCARECGRACVCEKRQREDQWICIIIMV